MRRFNHSSIGRFRPLILLVFIGLLAACGGGEEPPVLVIPTVAATAAAPTLEPTADGSLPTAAATILPTATPVSYTHLDVYKRQELGMKNLLLIRNS